jgi:phytoene dehydrogenase-like protein
VEFDAVVVGAGHNGLAAATHLASKGWKLGVFERNPVAGGAVQTRELTLPGFRHDLAAMNLSLFAGSPYLREHGPALARHGLAFVPAEHCFATPFPDGTWFGISKDLEETLERIRRRSAKDAESYSAMLRAFASDAPHIFGLLGNPMPSWATAKVAWKGWRSKGTGWMLETLRLLLASPRAFLDENFESPEIKATMAAWGMHLDFAPDIAGGALFPYLETMANQSFGMVIGKGGADTMINALTGYLKELGGELHLNAEVTSIDTTAGTASGITLKDGRKALARRAVIANVVPQLVFGNLLEPELRSTKPARRMQQFRPGPGTAMVHIACKSLPRWTAGSELQRFAYVHLAPSLEQMARTYAEAMAGMIPQEPVLVVGQPTAIDSSRAPQGHHILWIQVRVLPAEISGDAGGSIIAKRWDEAKEALADRVIGIIECYAPEFRNEILGRAVFSPGDLQHENPCLIGGDNLSGSHHLSQNFLFRPAPGWSRYKMPVPNLYLCGAATWPGAGVGAGSGYMLGKMLAGH